MQMWKKIQVFIYNGFQIGFLLCIFLKFFFYKSGHTKMALKSECYRCHKNIPPISIKPIDKEDRTANSNPKGYHSCRHKKCKKGKTVYSLY